MLPSLIKILDGVFFKGETRITLTVESLKGRPKVNDCLFYTEPVTSTWGGYVIESVKKTASPKQYEIVVPFDKIYDTWEKHWKGYSDDRKLIAICGLSVNAFDGLTIEQKQRYFSVLAGFIGKGRVTGFLKSNIIPSLKFAPLKGKEPVSLTKFGGLPVAPKGFIYPKDKNGQSLLFIGQMHIAELKQRFRTSQQFKGNGILYFFGSIRTKDAAYSFETLVIEYAEDIRDVMTVDLPPDLNEYGVFEESGMVITEEVTVTDPGTSFFPGEEMTDEEKESVQVICNFDTYYNWSRTMDHSQLLGHPPSTQQGVSLETELEDLGLSWPQPEKWQKEVSEINADAKQWRMLLRLHGDNDYFSKLSHFNGDFNKYGAGSFYVMIKEADLDLMNFKNTVSIYQSS